jgi:hypothetical protein
MCEEAIAGFGCGDTKKHPPTPQGAASQFLEPQRRGSLTVEFHVIKFKCRAWLPDNGGRVQNCIPAFSQASASSPVGVCLNERWFTTLAHARAIIAARYEDYYNR